jgi:hypothetical protein
MGQDTSREAEFCGALLITNFLQWIPKILSTSSQIFLKKVLILSFHRDVKHLRLSRIEIKVFGEEPAPI